MPLREQPEKWSATGRKQHKTKCYFCISWREHNCVKKSLKTTKSPYFSTLLEENKNNPLFETVAKWTKSNTAVMTL